MQYSIKIITCALCFCMVTACQQAQTILTELDNGTLSINGTQISPSVTPTPSLAPTTSPTTPSQAGVSGATAESGGGSSASLGNIVQSNTWLSKTQGWIFPGNPACGAATVYTNNKISVLKPEYFSIQSSGQITTLTTGNSGCNGYSVANAQSVLQNSVQQFATVSCASVAGMKKLFGSAALQQTAITTLTDFLSSSGFTGVELDFEGFSSWTNTEYTEYLSFVNTLGTTLHSTGNKLMIDGPGIGNSSDQTSFLWKYEDFNSLPVDYLVVMAYDYQYNYAVGSPVAPNDWVTGLITWTKSKISSVSRIVMGIPAYGYHGVTDSWTLTEDSYAQSSTFPGFSTATRDPSSFEMFWTNGGNTYFYPDSTSLNSKRALIESEGITNVSVWYLGDNDWFTGKTEPN